jgi:hypothetical protein
MRLFWFLHNIRASRNVFLWWSSTLAETSRWQRQFWPNRRAGRGAGSENVQNEPNSSIADCGLGTDLRRDACPATYRLRPARGDCAKRTQFRPNAREWAQTAGAAEGKTCKTNPISSSLTGTRRPKCAKRSQTWAGWDIRGTVHPRGQSCKTNPIPRLRIGDWGQTCCRTPALRPTASGLRGATVQNEANFARAPGNGRRPPGPPRAKRVKRTQFRAA